MPNAADSNNGNTHRLFFMKWILELYDGPYPEIPFERGTFSVANADLQIRGRGGGRPGHPDPEIRGGGGWPVSKKIYFGPSGLSFV